MGPLRVMIAKEFLQLRRDRKMIPILFIAPLIQLIVLGYAANMDVTRIPTLLIDLDRTSVSRALVDRFVDSGYFQLAGTADSVTEADDWLIRGGAQIVLVIGAGYGDALGSGQAADLQVLADGSDSTTAGLGLSYASSIVSGIAATRLLEQVRAIARGRGGSGAVVDPPATIALVPRVWYNPDLKSRWFFTPAILALVLMLMTMILPSMAVVREKEIGTLEQISVTPIRAWHLIVGKLFPFALIGLLDLLLVTALVVGVFGVPLHGTLAALILLSIPFLLTTLAIGLLVSTLVRTQQQAMMASTFFGMLPMIYLSGLIFPIENMPPPIQLLTYAIPLRYYAVIIRGVFLKGVGVAVLWPQALALLGFGTGLLLLATLRFRKSLD
jgi:drug efflux transport system permease protein